MMYIILFSSLISSTAYVYNCIFTFNLLTSSYLYFGWKILTFSLPFEILTCIRLIKYIFYLKKQQWGMFLFYEIYWTVFVMIISRRKMLIFTADNLFCSSKFWEFTKPQINNFFLFNSYFYASKKWIFWVYLITQLFCHFMQNVLGFYTTMLFILFY